MFTLDFIIKKVPQAGNTQVCFYANLQGDYIQTQLAYLWDFGDGKTSVEVNPKHHYQHKGVYQVELTVQTLTGETLSKQKNVFIDTDYVEAVKPSYPKNTNIGINKAVETNKKSNKTNAKIFIIIAIIVIGLIIYSNFRELSLLWEALPGKWIIAILSVISTLGGVYYKFVKGNNLKNF